MAGYRLVEITSKDGLDRLYESSALTFDGLIADDANITELLDFLASEGCEPKDDLTVYIYIGKLMNDVYSLTGTNAYPDDLPFLSIDLDEFGDTEALSVAKMMLGARWFDDIVNSNALREMEQGNPA